MKTRLERLMLTNDEFALLTELVSFLAFMRSESAPVPEDGDELEALLAKYVRHHRRRAIMRMATMLSVICSQPNPLRNLQKRAE